MLFKGVGKKKAVFIFFVLILAFISLCVFWLYKDPDNINIIEISDPNEHFEQESIVFFDASEEEKSLAVDSLKGDDELKIEELPSVSLGKLPELDSYEDPVPISDTVVEVKLTGILYDYKSGSSVIVEVDGNDYWLKIGEKVGSITILSIDERKVIIDSSGKQYSLIVGEIVYLTSSSEIKVC